MAYSQNDRAWKNVLLGFNTSSEFTLGTAGCYVTAIANVVRWAGNDHNPEQINEICKQNKWFTNGGQINRNDIPALLCSNLAFAGRTNWSGPVNMDFFADASDPNTTYIIEIDASPAAGLQTHYVMVWARSGPSDLEIDDSWDGVRKLLSHYGPPSKVIYSAMKFVKVQPVQAPTAPAVTVQPINPKQVKVKPGAHEWDLTKPTFEDIANAPLNTAGDNTILTAVATLQRSDMSQYTYYLTDENVRQGYNVNDVDDYTPPRSYNPPAAPASVPMAQKLELLVDMPFYSSVLDAKTSNNPKGTLPKDEYYVFSQENKIFDLSDDNQKDKGQYVNTLYNVALPTASAVVPTAIAVETPAEVVNDVMQAAALAPAPKVVVPPINAADQSWKATLKPLLTSGKSVRFQILQDMYVYDMTDLSGKGIELKESDPENKNTWLPVKYYFVKNNAMYLCPFLEADTKMLHYFGIITSDTDSGLPALKSELYTADIKGEREYRKDQGRMTSEDQLFYARQKIAKLVNAGVRFLDIIPVEIKRKVKTIKK